MGSLGIPTGAPAPVIYSQAPASIMTLHLQETSPEAGQEVQLGTILPLPRTHIVREEVLTGLS